MSDAIWLALIDKIPAIVTAAMTIAVTVLTVRNGRNIKTLEKNTNSMKDALVKVTGEAEFARGLKQGGEDVRAR